jgi:hypothetical protein
MLDAHQADVKRIDWLLINRDLYGRVRLIAPETARKDDASRTALETLAVTMAERLGAHAYPPDLAILYEAYKKLDFHGAAAFRLEGHGAAAFRLEGHDNVWLVDRLATESNWASIAPESTGAPRVVFFSIKGGVGRSTAVAACAWKLAQLGKRVLILDLDLESPGLSTHLLPFERQPRYGITDWLVEDLVDNGQSVFEEMYATSELARDGEIYVVPAHGREAGEYVAKLGRVWMPKIHSEGTRDSWSCRLQRLLQALEERLRPDVILIDSRAGIDEIASACVTDLGAKLVLLFALDGNQTWSGYRILFQHWLRAGVAQEIRKILQIVAALVPEIAPSDYLADLREHAYDLFLDTLYDEIEPADTEGWSFDLADETAPHRPLAVRWHRGFAALRTLYGRFEQIDENEIRLVFGDLIDFLLYYLEWGDGYIQVIDGGRF